MACTLAVEEVIDKHYEEQEIKLKKDIKDLELLKLVQKFRKEEIEHKNIALENNATNAKGYNLLSFGIKNITKIAIKISRGNCNALAVCCTACIYDEGIAFFWVDERKSARGSGKKE